MRRSGTDELSASVRLLATMAQRGEAPGSIGAALAQELTLVLDADQVHIVELDNEGRATSAVSYPAGADPDENTLDPENGATAIAVVISTGRPAVVSDARRAGALPPELVNGYAMATAALLPIEVAGEIRSVVVVGSRIPRPWPAEEIALGAALADVLAVAAALHDARLAASIDHLTGCLNHGAMLARLDEEIDRASRQGTALSVLLLDLDDFKSVNDTHGHTTGDGLLREVGVTLCREFRSFDQVARYGGDEFLVVLPNVRGPRTEVAASRAVELMRRVRFERPDGAKQGITVSVGAAEWCEGETAGDLLKKASSAMRQGKVAGKDRVGRFVRPSVIG